MSEHVYKKVELAGSSTTSVEDAIQNAIGTAAKTLKHLEWFKVSKIRGHIVDEKVGHYQVVMKVGFRIQDE